MKNYFFLLNVKSLEKILLQKITKKFLKMFNKIIELYIDRLIGIAVIFVTLFYFLK